MAPGIQNPDVRLTNSGLNKLIAGEILEQPTPENELLTVKS